MVRGILGGPKARHETTRKTPHLASISRDFVCRDAWGIILTVQNV